MEKSDANGRGTTRGLSFPGIFWAGFALLFLALHGLALAIGGGWAAHASFVFLIGAPFLAGLASLHRGRRLGWEGWLPLALGMACWTGGMAAAMVVTLFPDVSIEPSAGILLYVLYGVPLIFVLASPEDEIWYVRLVDGALALALGGAYFLLVFKLTGLSGEDNFVPLRLMFDVENIYLSLFAAVRFLACVDGQRRTFFRALAAYAILYLLAAAYINHLQSDTDFGHAPDLVIDIPFLVLMMMAGTGQGKAPLATAVPSTLVRVVRAASPLMLPASLLTVSALLLEHDGVLAIAGCILAALGYGLRTVLVQLRGFDERDRLERLSHVDALTGLANRRHFDDVLRREAGRARRQGTALGLMMIDIDHFKQLNDCYGHSVGDARLRDVAGALAASARSGVDLVARYGGEEFAVILPGVDARDAAAMAEATRARIEAMALASPAPAGIVTVSIGLAHATTMDANVHALLNRADQALYDAKRGGRNRVERVSFSWTGGRSLAPAAR